MHANNCSWFFNIVILTSIRIKIISEIQYDTPDESSSSDEDSSGDEEYTGKKVRTSSLRSPKQRKLKNAPKATKRVQIQARPTSKKPITRRINQKPKRRNFINAINNLAKKILHEEELTTEGMQASLFAALMCSGQRNQRDLHEIASDLVNQHNQDPNAAQCALLNLLFRSIGGSLETNLDPSKHNLEELNDDDMGHIITELVDQMRFTPLDRIVLSVDLKDTQSLGVTEYKSIFRRFWSILSEVALNEGSLANFNESMDENDSDGLPISQSVKKSLSGFVRFDVDLVRDIILRITEVSSVGQPDVRASATLAVLNMAESILHQSYMVKKKMSTTKRYLDAASGNRKKESLSYQYESLQRTHDNLIDVVLGPIMQGIFIHRYRDSNSTIRVACQDSLSKMSLIRPDLLLSDQYLKYFGWFLSDKNAEVRIAAISALLAPLKRFKLQQQDSVEVRDTPAIKLQALEHVFSKFLGRLADCILDISTEVQSKAMELLLHLLREGFMDEVEDENLWNQINIRAIASDTIPQVRKNALYFVMEQLEEFDEGGADEEEDTVPLNVRFSNKNDIVISDRVAQKRLDSLASWLAHALSDGPVPLNQIQIRLANFVVTSLRYMPEHRSLVKDWSALLAAISDDKVATLDGLTAGDRVDVVKQKVLVQMLTNAASLEMERDNTNEGNKSQERLSQVLLTKLPKLIMDFKSDSMNLSNLTVLPSYLGTFNTDKVTKVEFSITHTF